MRLSPNWLADQFYENTLNIGMMSPDMVPLAIHPRFTEQQVIELRLRYKAQFKRWTGVDL